MAALRPRRSALYLPASNPKALAKARTLACDSVILDLEDAVAPDAKDVARAAAVAALHEGGFGRRELVVRSNALSSPWGEADMKALAAAGIETLLIPKVDSAADIAACRRLVGDKVSIWVMIETAQAMFRLDEIAGASGVFCLVLGANDIAKELRAIPGDGRAPLQAFLSFTVAAARAHGRSVLDGVYNAIDDAAGFAAECSQGRAFGFDGKTLIHPSQIDTCHAVFTPPPEEVIWARKVVEAFDDPATQALGVIRVEGKMVERLHLEQARQILAIVEAIGAGD